MAYVACRGTTMSGTIMSMYYVVWFCMKYIMYGMHNVQIASDCDTVTFIRRTAVNVQRTELMVYANVSTLMSYSIHVIMYVTMCTTYSVCHALYDIGVFTLAYAIMSGTLYI